MTSHQCKKVKKRKKPLEYAFNLLKACDEESECDDTLRKGNITERGVIELLEDDNEQVIREKLLSSLKATYQVLGRNNFEFVKVTQKKICVLRMAEGTEFNYSIVKTGLAGSLVHQNKARQ